MPLYARILYAHGPQRLQVALAKFQQSLPEIKRDGDTVLSSVSAELLYDETSNTRMGSIVPLLDFIPQLAQQLQESPAEVIKDLEEIRRHGRIGFEWEYSFAH